MMDEIKEKAVDISKDSTYVSIFRIVEDKALIARLFEFYLYSLANTSDSPLSYGASDSLSNEQKDSLLKKLFDSISVSESDMLFDPILRNKIKDIRKMNLSDTTLQCDRIKGFFHISSSKSKAGTTKQHKFDSLFKHIRNSFAHGRIAPCRDYMILEDKVNEMTGRLVISIEALDEWISIISDYLDENNLGGNNDNLQMQNVRWDAGI